MASATVAAGSSGVPGKMDAASIKGTPSSEQGAVGNSL